MERTSVEVMLLRLLWGLSFTDIFELKTVVRPSARRQLLAENAISAKNPQAVADWFAAASDSPLWGVTMIACFRPEAVIRNLEKAKPIA